MARLISDIVQSEIIDRLDGVLKITEVGVYDFGTGTQPVKFCSTKWLDLYNSVIFFGDELEVSGPDGSGFYTVQLAEAGNFPPNGSITVNSLITLKNPLLFVGTLLNTRVEWARFSKDEKEKLPFIWLTKPTSETFRGKNPSVERTSNLILWFVHWSDWGKLNADREQEAVRPIFELVEAFTKAITGNTSAFLDFQEFSTEDFPKLATETPDGAENMIFNSTLSAVRVNISIDILVKNCNNC